MRKVTFYYYSNVKGKDDVLATRTYLDNISYKDMMKSVRDVCICFRSVLHKKILYKVED